MDKQVVVYVKSIWWLRNKRADNKKKVTCGGEKSPLLGSN
jgi:hypothetical protein